MDKKQLIGAALSGIFAFGLAQANEPAKKAAPAAAKAHAEAGQCHGITDCKGHSDCHGKDNACKGQNSCKGKGWVKMTEQACKDKKGEWKAFKA